MTQLSLFQKESLLSELKPHIVKRFLKYHADNPHLYELFKRFSTDLKRSARRFYGAKAIMERIRWHINIETKGEEFKISNNYTSCYARLLIADDPWFKEFFKTKRTRG